MLFLVLICCHEFEYKYHYNNSVPQDFVDYQLVHVSKKFSISLIF